MPKTNPDRRVARKLARIAEPELRVELVPVENAEDRLVAALKWLLSLPGKKKEAA